MNPTGTEQQVCQDIAARQQKGRAKYATTVADNPLPLREWLQHAYEECLDQAVYLKRAIGELAGKAAFPPPSADWGQIEGFVMGNKYHPMPTIPRDEFSPLSSTLTPVFAPYSAMVIPVNPDGSPAISQAPPGCPHATKPGFICAKCWAFFTSQEKIPTKVVLPQMIPPTPPAPSHELFRSEREQWLEKQYDEACDILHKVGRGEVDSRLKQERDQLERMNEELRRLLEVQKQQSESYKKTRDLHRSFLLRAVDLLKLTQTYYFDQTGCRDADIEKLLKDWSEA